MAMRRFNQFTLSLEAKQVRLFAKATIGASGAVTLNKSAVLCKGVKSITKLGTAGQYQITLEDSYNKLLGVDAIVQNATGIPASGTMGLLTSGTVVGASGGGTIVVQFSTGGAATNPASGDVIYFEIVLGDSSV